jgi:hypothetical protein
MNVVGDAARRPCRSEVKSAFFCQFASIPIRLLMPLVIIRAMRLRAFPSPGLIGQTRSEQEDRSWHSAQIAVQAPLTRNPWCRRRPMLLWEATEFLYADAAPVFARNSCVFLFAMLANDAACAEVTNE